MNGEHQWQLVVRKQADFNFTQELDPDDFIEIRINGNRVTEKAVTTTLRALVNILEDIRIK